MTDLDQFDISEIIEYLERKGYNIAFKNSHMKDVFFYYSNGNTKEALFLLERIYPELKGISNKVQ